jgi:hypothetical protein
MCSVWWTLLGVAFLTPYTLPMLRHPGPPAYYNIGQWTIHYIAVTTVLRSWRCAKDCPKHVELIQRSIKLYYISGRSIKLLLLHLVDHLYYSPIFMMHGQTQIKLTLRFFSHFNWDWYTGICRNSYFTIQGAVSGPVIKLTNKKTFPSAVKMDTIYFNIAFGFPKYNQL